MIHWLEDNVQGTPTIMEGLSDNPLYHWSNRISIYTGLPDVIGWNWHQKQQRSLDPYRADRRNAQRERQRLLFHDQHRRCLGHDPILSRQLRDRRWAGTRLLSTPKGWRNSIRWCMRAC